MLDVFFESVSEIVIRGAFMGFKISVSRSGNYLSYCIDMNPIVLCQFGVTEFFLFSFVFFHFQSILSPHLSSVQRGYLG